MNKIFKSLEELLNFDFSGLRPQKSNYLKLIPDDGVLPKVNKKFHPERWFGVTYQKEVETEIIFEITPMWVTITIKKGKESRKENFRITPGKDAKSIIKEIFEQESSK